MWTDWKFEDVHIRGFSQAGTGSCYLLPDLKIVMDTAQGLPPAYSAKFLLLTHGHIDHAGGVAYILSQRGLMGLPELPIYLPSQLVDPLDQILKTWQKIEGFEYKYQFRPLDPGDYVPLKEGLELKAIKTKHRIPSIGFCLIKHKKKLKDQYSQLSSQEIVELKKQKIPIEETVKQPWLAYSGDSEIEFLQDSEVQQAKVLLMECTYIDDVRSVEHAKEWGHIHIDEVLPRLDELKNQKILLTHISSRYKKSDIQTVLKERLPEKDQNRVEYFR